MILTLHNLQYNPGRRKTRLGFSVSLTAILVITALGAYAQPDIFEEEEHLDPVNVSVQPVNRKIGDISYVVKYGVKPTKQATELDRIQTHLEFVEQELRTTPVFHLTEQQLENRYRILDFLHTYWTAGKFPTNYHFANRRLPVFKDADGNLCAVAFLIQQTAGDDVVNQINRKHKFHYIEAMNETYITQWMNTQGLSVDECAMIQPTYNYRYEKPVDPPCFDTSSKPIELYEVYQLDSAAQFKGGDKAFYEFMKENQKYPQLAIESGIEGTVFLSFVISPYGQVCNITLLRGVAPILDEEAKRLVRLTSGYWTPGKVRNQVVYTKYTVPIKFRLDR